MRFGALAETIAVVLLAVACNGNLVVSQGAATGNAATRDAAPADASTTSCYSTGPSVETVSYTSIVVEFTSGIPPIEGVKVCLRGARPDAGAPVQRSCSENCTTTDAKGHFTLDALPQNTRLLLSYQKDGYIPTLREIRLPTSPGFDAYLRLLRRDNWITQQIRGHAIDVDMQAAGFVPFAGGTANDPQSPFLPDVTGDLEAPSGADPGADGPFYFGDGQLYPGATTTPPVLDPSSPTFGVYVNVPPGDYSLDISRHGAKCEYWPNFLGEYGWSSVNPLDQPNNQPVDVHIEAGWITFLVARGCT